VHPQLHLPQTRPHVGTSLPALPTALPTALLSHPHIAGPIYGAIRRGVLECADHIMPQPSDPESAESAESAAQLSASRTPPRSPPRTSPRTLPRLWRCLRFDGVVIDGLLAGSTADHPLAAAGAIEHMHSHSRGWFITRNESRSRTRSKPGLRSDERGVRGREHKPTSSTRPLVTRLRGC